LLPYTVPPVELPVTAEPPDPLFASLPPTLSGCPPPPPEPPSPPGPELELPPEIPGLLPPGPPPSATTSDPKELS